MARNRSTARASLLTERLFSFWVILLVSFPQSSYNSKRCFFTQALAQSFDSRRVSIVTGGNGYIGREIVQVLLQQQQEDQPEPVFCLVREKRVASEKEYWNNNDSVTVFPYDMLDGGETLTQALQHACQNDKDAEVCIYHVASVFGPSDNHVQTAKDNVKGTEDLVKAVAKFHHSGTTNCRLVVTSSMAAVRGSGQTPKNGKYYTHEDWNTISQLDDKNWGSCYQW